MERSYGTKYSRFFTGADGKGIWRTAAEIAKAIRADIKDEIDSGTIPGKPVTYSVRVHNYSGGRSINIEVRDLPDAWVTAERDGFGYRTGDQILSEEAKRVKDVVQGIHRSYNYDGSNVMVDYFDVNFYGHAEIESEWSRNYRLSQKAARAAKKESV